MTANRFCERGLATSKGAALRDFDPAYDRSGSDSDIP